MDACNNCQTLTRVTQIRSDSKVDLAIRVYLPFPPELPRDRRGRRASEPAVQVKLGRGKWRTLARDRDASGYWHLDVERVSPGTALRFRYRHEHTWHPFAPLSDLERVYEVSYVPQLNYQWSHEPPTYNRARVVLETTLEGLVANYEGGVFAPRSREELFRDPIAKQMLRTAIPSSLAGLGIDAIAIATNSSMADRSYLNPSYNYLTYDVADFDWQLGEVREVMALADTLYGLGCSLIPELIFAHQVRHPFPGSLDTIDLGTAEQPVLPFVDRGPATLYDYGTWMFRLEDPQIRRQLVEKIVSFAVRYRLRFLRLNYLDGLVHQYSQRETNYGEVLLQELKAELSNALPDLRIASDAFSARDNPVVRDCVNLFYVPYGIPIAEVMYALPLERDRPQYPDFDKLVPALQQAAGDRGQHALYAQRYDTSDRDKSAGRASGPPSSPQGNPVERAKEQGELLVEMGNLPVEDLLDYTRRIVRNVEALTMFVSKLTYVFAPATDSLALGDTTSAGNWKFSWDNVSPEQLEFWEKRDLSDDRIFFLHKQHRQDMSRLRQIFRAYTPVDPAEDTPLVASDLYHVDRDRGILGLLRTIPNQLYESLIVLFNLGPVAYKQRPQDESGTSTDSDPYPLPLPSGFSGKWEVLFDGDWVDPLLRTSDRSYYIDTNEDLIAYDPGTILQSTPTASPSTTTASEALLPVNLGGFSCLILKYHREVE